MKKMFRPRSLPIVLFIFQLSKQSAPTISNTLDHGTGINPDIYKLADDRYALFHVNPELKIKFHEADGTPGVLINLSGNTNRFSAVEVTPGVLVVATQTENSGTGSVRNYKCFASNNTCLDLGVPYTSDTGDQTAPVWRKLNNENKFVFVYDDQNVITSMLYDENLNELISWQSLATTTSSEAIPQMEIFPSDRIGIAYQSGAASDQTSVLIVDNDWAVLADYVLPGFYAGYHYVVMLSTGELLVSRNYKHESGDPYSVRLDKIDDEGNLVDFLIIETGGTLGPTTFCKEIGEGLILVTWHDSVAEHNYGALVTVRGLAFLTYFDFTRAVDTLVNYGRGALFDNGIFRYVYYYFHVVEIQVAFEDIACLIPNDCPASAPVCDQTIDQCTIYPTISIDSDPSTVCPNDELTLTITSNSQLASRRLVVTSNSTDQSAFESHVNGLVWDGELTIPASLIEVGVEYVFELEVITETRQVIFQPQGSYNYLTFVSSELLLNADPEEISKIEIQSQNCLESDFSLTASQTKGPTLDLNPYIISSDEIEVSECKLFYNQVYEYSITSSYNDAPWIKSDSILIIQTEEILHPILGPSSILSNEELDLSAPEELACFDGIKYKWVCNLSRQNILTSLTSLIDCPNQGSQLNTFSQDLDSITLSPDNYNPEDTIIITLFIKYGGAQISIQKEIYVSSYIEASLIDTETACSLQIGSTIDESESEYYYSYEWKEISSNTGFASLRQYLSTQTMYFIVVPGEYISPNSQYSFEVSYTNFRGNIITGELEILTATSLPEISIEGGVSQNWVTFSDQSLRAQLDCLPEDASMEWTQISGPSLDLFQQLIPSTLEFNKCTLEPDEDYEFRFTLTSGSQSKEVDVLIATQSEEFRVEITDGSRVHKSTESLELEVAIITPGGCPFTKIDELSYEWECKKAESVISTFEDCDDPNSLFGVERTGNKLVVPTTYFELHNVLQIGVTVEDDSSNTFSSRSTYSIEDENVFKAQLSCDSDLSCYLFSPQVEYIFEVEYSTEGQTRVNSFWSLQPYIESVSFINIIKTIPYDGVFDRSSTRLKSFLLESNIQNSTHRSSVQLAIPINFAPYSGSLTVSPTMGQALTQQFLFNAPGWTDDEAPLSYRYLYWHSSKPEWQQRAFQAKSLSTSYKTIIPSNSSSTADYDINIRVEVIDPYEGINRASSSITILQRSLSPSQKIYQIQQILDVIFQYQDPQQKSDQLNLVSQSSSSNEKSIVEEGQSGESCSCNGNGECDSNKNCVCDQGYSSKFCELFEDEFDQIIQYKLAILQELENLIVQTNDKQTITSIISDLTESKYLNTDEVLNKAKQQLDQIIDLENEEIIINSNLANTTANVVDNMLKYAGENDCSLDGEFTKQVEEDLEKYLNKIINGAIQDKITNEQTTAIYEEQYSLQARKLEECSIRDEIHSMGDDDAPSLQLNRVQSLESLNCTKEIILKYIAFNDQMFDCSRDGQSLVSNSYKPLIILEIIDSETGEDISDEYSVTVINPPGSVEECQAGCVDIGSDSGVVCSCNEESSIFDVKGQISRIFSQSNIGKVDLIDPLNLAHLPQFWLAFSFTLFTAGLQIVILKVKPNFCLVEKIQNGGQLSALKVFGALFLFHHPLLNIPTFKVIEPSKTARLWVFFCRLNMMLAIVSIFGNQSGISVGSLRFLQDLNLGVDIYLLIIPFCTFIPLTALLLKLLAIGQKRKIQNVVELQSHKRKKFYTCSWYTGLVLMVFISIASLYSIISIAQNSEYSENMQMMGFFGRTLAQDWILTPLIMMLLTSFIAEPIVVQIMAKQEPNTIKDSPNSSEQSIKKNQVFPLKAENVRTLPTETNILLLSPSKKLLEGEQGNETTKRDEDLQEQKIENKDEKLQQNSLSIINGSNSSQDLLKTKKAREEEDKSSSNEEKLKEGDRNNDVEVSHEHSQLKIQQQVINLSE